MKANLMKNKTFIRPLQDYIVVKRTQTQNKTDSGILIPPSAAEKSSEGIVIAVGNKIAEKIYDGDRVIFRKYSGTEIKVNDEEQLILHISDLLGVIEEKKQL
jgi:chaperonin GroES